MMRCEGLQVPHPSGWKKSDDLGQEWMPLRINANVGSIYKVSVEGSNQRVLICTAIEESESLIDLGSLLAFLFPGYAFGGSSYSNKPNHIKGIVLHPLLQV